MNSQTSTTQMLQAGIQPPAQPTLSFTPNTSVSASTYTILDSAAVVTDGGNKLEAIRVSLSGTGNGVLGVVQNNALSATGTIGNIDYSYDAAKKVLSLTDRTAGLTATGADFTNVLKLIGYDAGGSAAGTTQEISVNLGRPIYSAQNGHYYEFVSYDATNTPEANRSWTLAKTSAASKTFLGLSGYLATVTADAENQFMSSRISSKGWIGGSSEGTFTGNRVWKWVAGPENGTAFWNGNENGTLVAGKYANWDGGEPNDSGGSGTFNSEPYAHFLANGKWNDLANTSGAGQTGNYTPDGYWVEYSTATGTGSDGLAGTRTTFNVTVSDGTTGTQDPAALDLVYYNPATGQVSFAFVGTNYNIVKAGVDKAGDTPSLTFNTAAGIVPSFGSNWDLVSAKVDVDGDKAKDIILRNKTSGLTLVAFGESRTGTNRQYAYQRVSYLTFGGNLFGFPDFSIDVVSEKLGPNGQVGLVMRSATTNRAGIATLEVKTVGGATSVVYKPLNSIDLGGAGWRAVGDGEFNADATTREVMWANDISGLATTWSLNAARNLVAGGVQVLKIDGKNVVTPKGGRALIGNLDNAGNDEVVWQNSVGGTVVWQMTAGNIGKFDLVTLVKADRIKALADVDGDGTLDLVGQLDTDGTIGAHTLSLTAGTYGLKGNGAAARKQYTISNTVYKPGKGGTGGLELVNVSQYDNLSAVG